jgi:hypothetical protein
MTPTSVTVACPKTATTGSVVAVSGTLSPAAAGAAVSVTHTEAGTTVVDHTVTDSGGSRPTMAATPRILRPTSPICQMTVS